MRLQSFSSSPKAGITPHLYSECTGVEEILPLLSATSWWDFPQTIKCFMAKEESPDLSSRARRVSRTQSTVRVCKGFLFNSRRLSLHSLLTPEVLLQQTTQLLNVARRPSTNKVVLKEHPVSRLSHGTLFRHHENAASASRLIPHLRHSDSAHAQLRTVTPASPTDCNNAKSSGREWAALGASPTRPGNSSQPASQPGGRPGPAARTKPRVAPTRRAASAQVRSFFFLLSFMFASH